MAKKKKTKQQIATELAEDLKREYERWNALYKYGGSDPSWEDGVNLNLVRNHIIYYKRRIEEELDESEYPDMYYAELPPEVDNKYMANSEEIRKQAVMSLNAMKTDGNYCWVLGVCAQFKEAETIVRCIRGLESAINRDDLVYMRRYKNPDYMISRMGETRKKIEPILGTEMRYQSDKNGQLSLFS